MYRKDISRYLTFFVSSLVPYSYSGSVAQQIVVRFLHSAQSSATWNAEITSRLILLRFCSIICIYATWVDPLDVSMRKPLHVLTAAECQNCQKWAIWTKRPNLLWRMMAEIGSGAVWLYTSFEPCCVRCDVCSATLRWGKAVCLFLTVVGMDGDVERTVARTMFHVSDRWIFIYWLWLCWSCCLHGWTLRHDILQSALIIFEEEASEPGLHMNWQMTKVQSMSDSDVHLMNLSINGEVVKSVESFPYLGKCWRDWASLEVLLFFSGSCNLLYELLIIKLVRHTCSLVFACLCSPFMLVV